jgi:hypothetical protein
VEAIPDIFNLAQKLVFASIIVYQEISYLYALFSCGLRSDSRLDFGDMHSSIS